MIEPIRKPTPKVKVPRPIKSRPHVIPASVRAATLLFWGSDCLWCGERGGAVDLHHKQRRSQGGPDNQDNLMPVHRKCHRQIHDNPLNAKARGFLA